MIQMRESKLKYDEFEFSLFAGAGGRAAGLTRSSFVFKRVVGSLGV